MAKHLLGLENFTKAELVNYLDNAEGFVEVSSREIKKVPSLRGKTIVNLFLEPSTRTRTSFEIAAKRLSADTINISGSDSSVNKGENLLDTTQTLEALAASVLVLRHRESGAHRFLATHLKNTSIVNAGDGTHEHPTQGLIDCLTLRQIYGDRFYGGLTIAIVGDVLHSRVARSNIFAHRLLGNKIRLVGPPTLLPDYYVEKSAFDYPNLTVHHSLKDGIEGVDAIIALRMQLERQDGFFVPSLKEYSKNFCLTENIIKATCPKAVLLHPGPVNRGVEVASDVAYGTRSYVNRQVTIGIAVRMAVLFLLTSGTKEKLTTVNES